MATTTFSVLSEELPKSWAERAGGIGPNEKVQVTIETKSDREEEEKLRVLKENIQRGMDEIERGEGLTMEETFREIDKAIEEA